jgi:TonB family protein
MLLRTKYRQSLSNHMLGAQTIFMKLKTIIIISLLTLYFLNSTILYAQRIDSGKINPSFTIHMPGSVPIDSLSRTLDSNWYKMKSQKPDLIPAEILYEFSHHRPVICNYSLPIEDTSAGLRILPKLLQKIVPEYPTIAIRAAIEGNVLVNVLVDTLGKPSEATLWYSDCGIFHEPSLVAVKKWLFSPFIKNGTPHEFYVKLLFKFRLHDGKAFVIAPN